MKTLLASVLSLLLLLTIWGIFFYHSEAQLQEIITDCEDQIIVQMETHHWQEASRSMEKACSRWKSYRRKALFFLDTAEINEIDYTFARTSLYIQSEDISNSSGELAALTSQLSFLLQNERLTLQNIL